MVVASEITLKALVIALDTIADDESFSSGYRLQQCVLHSLKPPLLFSFSTLEEKRGIISRDGFQFALARLYYSFILSSRRDPILVPPTNVTIMVFIIAQLSSDIRIYSTKLQICALVVSNANH